MNLNWTYSQTAHEMKSSAIREILKITERPDVISFAGGLPAPELFPVNELKQACINVLEKQGPSSLQYSVSMGYRKLREFLALYLSKDGREATLDNFLITAGSQQGLDMVGKAFLDHSSTIIVSSPTYLGAIQAFNAYRPKYITVEMDEEGMITEQVEEKIKRYKPRFVYVVSNFLNPSGITLSLKRRKHLVELAKEYYIPIVDDNPYGQLRFTGENLPSLQSLGRELVIELGTFSKLVSPGLRIGWIIASTQVLPIFERIKQGADLHTNTFAQYVVYEYAKNGALEAHIEKLKVAYLQRRNIMIEAMEKEFPPGITWTKPEGGLFLWVKLPEGVSATKLLEKAVADKVAYIPGEHFFVDQGGKNTLRLNFSNASPEMIREGIKRLGKVFKENI